MVTASCAIAMISKDYFKLIQVQVLPQSLTFFVCFVSAQPPYIHATFSWKGVNKPQGSCFYVGTSRAFDMALYTACVLESRVTAHTV